MLHHILLWFFNGANGTSDFSGMAGWEMGIHMLLLGLQAQGYRVPVGCVYMHRFADIKADSRQTAIASRTSVSSQTALVVGPCHVFGNIMSRCGKIWEDLHKAKVKAESTATTDKEGLLEVQLEVRKELERNKNHVYCSSSMVDLCYVHNSLCPVEAHII